MQVKVKTHGGRLALRARPSSVSEAKDWLPPGRVLLVEADGDRWISVKDTTTQKFGWVYKRWVEEVSETTVKHDFPPAPDIDTWENEGGKPPLPYPPPFWAPSESEVWSSFAVAVIIGVVVIALVSVAVYWVY